MHYAQSPRSKIGRGERVADTASVVAMAKEGDAGACIATAKYCNPESSQPMGYEAKHRSSLTHRLSAEGACGKSSESSIGGNGIEGREVYGEVSGTGGASIAWIPI